MLMAKPIHFACACKSRAGFTLVEMSVVLIILGLVILTLCPALKAARDGSQLAATYTNMQTVLRASAACAQAQGCVPCPSPANALPAGFGRVGGRETGPACGSCAVAEGLVPYASLGLPTAVAKDGWGRWLTMRIDPDLAAPQPQTCAPGVPCAPLSPLAGLCAGTLAAGTQSPHVRTPPDKIGARAAIVIVSHGPNGFGAYRTWPYAPALNAAHPAYNGTAPSCATPNGSETCNADGNADFTAPDPTFTPSSQNDDVVVFAGRNALVSLFGTIACQTPWE